MLGLALAAPPATVAQPTERVAVLVLFDERPTARDLATLERTGARIDHRYRIVPAVAAVVPEAALEGLRRNPRVRAVEPDAVVRGLDYRSTHDWGIGHIKANQVHAAGNTGTAPSGPVRVAVVDSGTSCEHLELQGRCE